MKEQQVFEGLMCIVSEELLVQMTKLLCAKFGFVQANENLER